MRVFVIEGGPLMLRHLRHMLKRMDYQVMTAEAVDDGLGLVRDWPFRSTL